MNNSGTIPTSRHLPLSYNQMFGYIFGLVYLGVGFAGYASTNGVAFAAKSGGRELIWFGVNPLHNLTHIAVGALLTIGAFSGPGLSRAINFTVGSVYLLLAVAGPIVVNGSLNVFGLNAADDLLHLATAVTALGVAVVLGSRDELQVTRKAKFVAAGPAGHDTDRAAA